MLICRRHRDEISAEIFPTNPILQPNTTNLTKMAVLEQNTQVLLKRRKNADRKRLQKLEERREQRESRKKLSAVPTDQFVRIENLALRNKTAKLEEKRVNNILLHELRRGISAGKEVQPRLLFVMRVPQLNKHSKMSAKAEKVLEILRLTEENMGVFVKATSASIPALKIVAPFIVVGQPSLALVRELFHKRAAYINDDGEKVKLDNNQVVEDVFGDDLGFVCVEDLVHELYSLGDNFKRVSRWIAPFKLTSPIGGKSPVAQLDRISYENNMKKTISLAGHVALDEIDIDAHIANQN